MPRLPRLPRISDHLPTTTILQEGFQDLRTGIAEMRTEIRTVANVIRIGAPRSMTKPGPESPQVAPKQPTAEGKECAPCEAMRTLQEAVGRKKVQRALANLKTGQGDKEKDVETLRKYVEGEDV
jgi:hypothetical protein